MFGNKYRKLNYNKMSTFSNAIEGIKKNELWKRKVIKNDTVVVCHKSRLYQMSKNTGVRYPYTPSNSDIMATDWSRIDFNE